MLSSVAVYGKYNVLPGFSCVYGVFSGLLVHPGIRFSSGSPPAPEFSRKDVSQNTHSKQQTSLLHTKTQALQPIKTALGLARGLQEGFFPPFLPCSGSLLSFALKKEILASPHQHPLWLTAFSQERWVFKLDLPHPGRDLTFTFPTPK